jgi:hypothetical protein
LLITHVADSSGVATGLPELPELPDQVAVGAEPDDPEVAAVSAEPEGAVPHDATATAARHNSNTRNPANRRTRADPRMSEG